MIKLTGIFDSHAHYNDERFSEDFEKVIEENRANGVCNVINIGCDLKSSRESIALAKSLEGFYATVGIHPHEAANADTGYIDALGELALEASVVAIGEIGLDYHYDISPREVQRRVFEEQLKLAASLSLPVVIHSREATADTMELLGKYKPAGVVHCFTGSAQTAADSVKLGLYIGFTGVVTFKNARKTLEAVAATPLDRLLLETDCPYMAPEPFRGERCRSDMIAYTAEAIARVKGISAQEVIDVARENTKRLFSL